ncbi:MAG: hypothetical protein ACI37Q_01545 [Candidatus Gastranaerophilaceae bacterium]
MSFISKVTGNIQSTVAPKAEILANRFIDGGWRKMGATYHAPRTNSAEEIIESLKLLAKKEIEKAKSGRKYLLELSEKGGYNIENQAKNSSRDIVDVALSLHQQNVEALNKIIAQGGAISGVQRQNYEKLLRIANLAQFIKASELKAKEIPEFLKLVGDMPQRHLSLAHDVVDLSNTNALINPEIFPSVNFNDIGTLAGTNKETTLMGYLLNMLPKLSKENPKALNLADTVLTHTDDSNSRFFLSRFLETAPITPEQTELTEKLVPSIAKDVLNGMPSMNLGKDCKENVFLSYIRHLCLGDSKPENIKLLDELMQNIDNICKKTEPAINLDDLRLGDTEKIRENLKVLPEVLKDAEREGKNIDASGFLLNNVNLVG